VPSPPLHGVLDPEVLFEAFQCRLSNVAVWGGSDLLACGKQESRHAHARSKTDGGNVTLDVFHGVVDGQTGHQLQQATKNCRQEQ
jgi:hypothetical protein